MNMKGFTLVELLAVVVIVGVLASIALPQYTKSVERARAAEAMTVGKNMIDAQDRFLTAYPGQTPSSKKDLDIVLNNGTWTSDSVYETENFTYTLSGSGVSIERKNGAFTIALTNVQNGSKRTCSGKICDSMKALFDE